MSHVSHGGRGGASGAKHRAAVAALAVAAAVAAAAPSSAQVFDAAQADALVGEQTGSEHRIQLFWHYLNNERDPAIHPPQWITQALGAMLARPVWKDPDEGILNEAQLWQAPASVLYQFFEVTRKTLGPQNGGSFVSPFDLIDDYGENHMRFEMSLDRLYRAQLDDSMGGRGRPLLAAFRLVDKEMGSLIDALANHNTAAYRRSVLAIAGLSNQAFTALISPPRPGLIDADEALARQPPGARAGSRAAAAFEGLVGAALFFAALWLFYRVREKEVDAYFDKKREQVRAWAREYERSFLSVKVNYLVGGPIAAGLGLGLVMWAVANVYGFIFFAMLGLFAGFTLPGWLLTQLRLRRGAACEAQLMDAMILMSNGLKSGVDLVQCLELVHRDLQPPISEEFGLCLKNYQLGTPLEAALEGIEARVASRLVSYMIKAVVLQRTVGGNITRIFDRIVENIREESKLVEKTAALTSQQRLQSLIVGIMPWGMFAMMFLFQPKMMIAYYFTPLGIITIFVCLVWIGIGMWIINRMGAIEL